MTWIQFLAGFLFTPIILSMMAGVFLGLDLARSAMYFYSGLATFIAAFILVCVVGALSGKL